MKVVITGGRDYHDGGAVWRALDSLQPQPTLIAQGECPTGADRFARGWAEYRGVQLLRYRADWKTHGRKAGPIRNREMLQGVAPDLVIAFSGGRGTADCVRQAEEMGIEVMRVP